MPITADQGGKNYTLGRGRAYFSRFSPAQIEAGITNSTLGEGRRLIGNCPEFNTSSEEETLDHFSSMGGIRTKDDSVTLQLDRLGNFTTDNIDRPNIAILFLSDAGIQVVAQTALTAQTYVLTAYRGRQYQIGEASNLPTGVRRLSNITVGKGSGFSTPVTSTNNWQVDEERGLIYILPGAPDIPDNTSIQVTYDRAAVSREQVVSGSKAIYGALHFIADNPKGLNNDYYFPYVKLAPEGDYNLISDEWQTMTFNFEILQKGSLAGCYIDGQPYVPA